jgi:hypothetical protein
MQNWETEIKHAVDNALLDTILFYATNYKESRDQICAEFKKQTVLLIEQVKKELDESDKL